MNDDMSQNNEPRGSRIKLVLIGFALIAGFFLIAEHRAHVVPYLPWLFLGACLVMHMFIHGGHGHGGHGGHHATGGDSAVRDGGPAADPRAGRATTGDAAAGMFGVGSSEPKTAMPPPDHSHHHGGSRT